MELSSIGSAIGVFIMVAIVCEALVEYFNMIFTGILFSRESNYFSDLVSKLAGDTKQDIKIMYGNGTDMEEFLNGGEDE